VVAVAVAVTVAVGVAVAVAVEVAVVLAVVVAVVVVVVVVVNEEEKVWKYQALASDLLYCYELSVMLSPLSLAIQVSSHPVNSII